MRLRPQRARVLGGQRAVPVLLPAAAGQAAAAPARSGDPDDARAGLEHRGQLRHQHQLAGVLRRVDPGPPGADGRLGGAELRLRRSRHGRGGRPGSGFARIRAGELGNFWVDLVRGTLRILLPLSLVAAIILIAGGAIQNFHLHDQIVNTLAGGQQTITGGPVASQEAIKELGTNGGGFYNANSAHPFENPTTWTNWVEIFLLLVISFSLPRTFGRMVGSKKQGYAIAAVMGVLAAFSWLTMLCSCSTTARCRPRSARPWRVSSNASASPTRRSSPTRRP